MASRRNSFTGEESTSFACNHQSIHSRNFFLSRRPILILFLRTLFKIMATGLTQRQQAVLDFLKSEHRKTGLIPSTREMQAHFGFASQTAAMSHLRALEKKGAVARLPGKARAVMFPDIFPRE